MKSEEELENLRAKKTALQRGNIALRVVTSTIEEQNAMYRAIITVLDAHAEELQEQVAQLEKQATEDNHANEKPSVGTGPAPKKQSQHRKSPRRIK